MVALGSELQRRGHNVTFFQIPDGKQKVLSAEIDCKLIGESEFPLGWTFQRKNEWGKLRGILIKDLIIGIIMTIRLGKKNFKNKGFINRTKDSHNHILCIGFSQSSKIAKS